MRTTGGDLDIILNFNFKMRTVKMNIKQHKLAQHQMENAKKNIQSLKNIKTSKDSKNANPTNDILKI